MRTSLTAIAAAFALACAPAATQPLPRQVAARVTAPDSSWVGRAALYQIFVRDFSPTGDLRGVINGLDRIQASGATTLWLMPIHAIGVKNRKGTLGSPYAARDYDAINPDFGTMADFKALVKAVHARKMTIILDWVPNHTAADSRWLGEHPDYFVRDAAGAPTTPRDAAGKLTDWTDVIQLDYANPAMRHAMIAAMQRWLVEQGIDGFRMDVAGFVPDDFWRVALPALRASVSRPILLLAEWGDLKMPTFGFDLIYSWDAYSRLKAVWRGDSAVTYVRTELADIAAMPSGGMRLRFTTNHDETSWDKPPVAIFGDSTGARAAFVAAAMMPGRPLLYNGQEVESPVVLRLFERDTIAWNAPIAASARSFYRRAMELVRTHPAFRSRDLALVDTSAPADVIAFRRGDVVVLVNTRPREVRITVNGATLDGMHDLLSNHAQRGNTLTLPPFGAMALERAGR